MTTEFETAKQKLSEIFWLVEAKHFMDGLPEGSSRKTFEQAIRKHICYGLLCISPKCRTEFYLKTSIEKLWLNYIGNDDPELLRILGDRLEFTYEPDSEYNPLQDYCVDVEDEEENEEPSTEFINLVKRETKKVAKYYYKQELGFFLDTLRADDNYRTFVRKIKETIFYQLLWLKAETDTIDFEVNQEIELAWAKWMEPSVK
jgi:hypothetical protein